MQQQKQQQQCDAGFSCVFAEAQKFSTRGSFARVILTEPQRTCANNFLVSFSHRNALNQAPKNEIRGSETSIELDLPIFNVSTNVSIFL